MRLYIYPPTAVSVTVPPIAYTDSGINTPVTPATPLPVEEKPQGLGGYAILNFATTNVTSSAFVELDPNVSMDLKKIQVFMSSGQSLLIAAGAPGSEDDIGVIIPGGNGIIDFLLGAGERLSVKSLGATVNSGELIVNYIG